MAGASAQSPYVSAGVDDNRNMGYQTPMPSLGAGVGWSGKRAYADLDYYHNFLVQKSGGVSGREEHFTGYAYLGATKSLYFGGGLEYAETATNAWSKSSVHPFGGMMAQGKPVRLFVSYLATGSDGMNHVQGVVEKVEILPKGRVVPFVEFGEFSYAPTDCKCSTRLFGAGMRAGVWVKLRKGRD